MTPAEWSSCEDAAAMLRLLRGRSGERKMRLLACACARSRWSGLIEDEYRTAVETAERFADGLATMEDLRAAWEAVWCVGFGGSGSEHTAATAAEATVEDFSAHAAERAVASVPRDAPALIREIFGDPFRDLNVDRRWPVASHERLIKIAQKAYEERYFEDLPRLADLLTEVGCLDEDLLAHLRSRGPHFRGCWALDTLLGKGPGKDVVTETEWLSETHPFYMLTWWDYLQDEWSPRKRRLLACACCRLIWPLLTDERLRRAVDIAEAFADGLADHAELAAAHAYASALSGSTGEILAHTRRDQPGWAALATAWRGAGAVSSLTDPDARHLGNAMHHAAQDGGSGRDTEDAEQANLIRDILGNPLRQVVIDPAWLRWKGGTVRRIAQAIYDERAFDRLPALAGALADAGCTESLILDHCRWRGSHVRGCWAVDAILGKR